MNALLADAMAGRGSALVLHGQPGVGKSALLADTVTRAEGLRVLRTRGVESESPLAFAAVQRLLRPVMGAAERLPEPQARALRVVFGQVDAGSADRFLVFLAVLSLLAEAAEEAPVLAVVDDAHWLDDASAAALRFAARRLETERVAMLFGARTGDVRTFDIGDLPALALTGIDPESAGALLRDRTGATVPAGVRNVLLAGTGGNPLALVELAEVLSADQLAGRAPLPDRLPLTGGVERAFLDRCRRLPSDAQTVLLVAAADDSGRLATVRSAAAGLGAEEEALEAAERSGLLGIGDGVVELRHPLVRSAVYGAATSTERRRVHGALAGAMPDDDDRRAWHLAASVAGPDESVVAALDGAAERAVRRGGHEAASATWERAAELSADPEERALRLYRAALSAWLAAAPARARVLAGAALALGAGPALRADVHRVLAHVEFHDGSLDEAHRMLLRAAGEVAPHDSRRAADLAMLAAALGAFGARSGSAVRPSELVPEPAADAPARDRSLAALVAGLEAVAVADWDRSTPALRRAVDLAGGLSDDTDEDLLLNLGIAAWPLGDDEAALRLQDRLLATARANGAVVLVVHALTRRNLPELATGRWAAARAGATEARTIAENSGQPVLAAWPAAVLALLAVLGGETDAAEEHLATVDRIAAAHPLGIVTELVGDLTRWARGLREPGGRGLHHLEQISSTGVGQLAALDRIEAAVHAGRHDLARRWVDELAACARGTGAAWAEAAVEHGRALLAEGEEALPHFDRALAAHARSPRTPDRARTELAYGSFLRRARRRVAAREHLRAALAVLDDLGAEPLAERARQELRASGETARRRDVGAAPALTSSERQIAGLVREGLSNRDIAGRLFVSPRTVDFHLRNVFSKLGVSSRTELAALPLE